MAFNWAKALGQGAAGTLGGAASGAMVGSAVPGIGTAIGAGVGGLTGFLASLLSSASGGEGSGSGYEQSPNKFSPEQQKALGQSLSMGQQNLQNPTAGFEPISQEARRQFNTQTVPGLAERFTALGGGQRSSAFQGALGAAGANLESQLAALKAEYGQRNQEFGLRQLQVGLEPQQESLYFGQRLPLGQQLLETGAGALGTYMQGGGTFGSLFGSPSQQGGQQGNIVLTPDMQQKLMRLLQLRGLL